MYVAETEISSRDSSQMTAWLECSMSARLLFVGLWTIADRNGRLEDRPKRIRAELFPYDEIDADAC